MAFSTGSAAGANAIDGPEVPEIRTDGLGLRGLNGDKRARITNAAWPSTNPPPSYASLLSIASANGLFAAAGPSHLIIGETQGARDVIYKTETDDVRDYNGILSISHNRLAHVAFSADESCLVVAEQNGASLIAYAMGNLKSRNSDPALRLDVGSALRAVVPNPDPAQAQFFALITVNGELLIADLEKAQLKQASNGPVIAQNASCVSWSTKGKQLVVGRGDGSALQITPEGEIKAQIPRPSSVPANCFVDQIAWISNDTFFFIYTPSNTNTDDGLPVSEYYIVNRVNPNFEFRKAPEIVYPITERLPAHFFMSRLRKYEPNLDSVIAVSATVGSDIRILSKTTQPLNDDPNTQNAFTLTLPNDDQGLTALPLGDDGDTTAIGMAIDLSDKDYIIAPISKEPDIEKTPGPVPLVTALNNEGILSVWAVLYHDAIRQGKQYSGFADMQAIQSATGSGTAGISSSQDMADAPTSAFTQQTQSQPAASNNAFPFAQQSQSTGFGSGSSFPKSSPFTSTAKPSWASQGFGDISTPQSTGQSNGPVFGATPSLGGANKAPAFGQTSLGQSSPAFGQTGFGNKAPAAFGQTGFGSHANTTLGHPSSTSPSNQPSPFGGGAASTNSPFSAFAGKGGFGSAENQQKESPFGAKPQSSGAFGQTSSLGSGAFGQTPSGNASPFAQASGSGVNVFTQNQPNNGSPFGQAFASKPGVFGQTSTLSANQDAKAKSPFGSADSATKPMFGNSSQPFKLDSSFKGDGSAKDDLPRPSGGSGFDFGGLGSMLDDKNEAKPSFSKEEDMDDGEGSETEMESSKKPTKTPPSTITQSKKNVTPPVSSLFGTAKFQSTTPAEKPPASTGFMFGTQPSTTPKDTPAANRQNDQLEISSPIDTPQPKDLPKIKHEEPSDDEGDSLANIPEAPLPPDPFSKPSYQAGDTSASSVNSVPPEPNDAPLPPDFVPANKTAARSLLTEESELPSVDFSDDLEGSGEEITGDISPVERDDDDTSPTDVQPEQVHTSPESSFGRAEASSDESPTGGPFTKVSAVEQPKSTRPLFGELGNTGPIFAPPKPQESPRSPSPVRKPPRFDYLRSPERSVSAPARPRSIIEQRKLEHQKSSFAMHAADVRAQEEERERARMAAERQAQLEVEKLAQQPLEDDEDAILQEELSKAIEPTPNLDPFITIQPGKGLLEAAKGRTDIPSQIEKLYQDINSMVVTLGINVRSLQSFMQYQQAQPPNANWPSVLNTETPGDALVDEWYLGDIERLPQGYQVLDRTVADAQVHNATAKLDQCQDLLSNEIASLKTKLSGLRKSMHSRNQPESNAHAALSAEQLSIQQDLRRASTSVQMRLGQLEENLAVLQAKIVEVAPQESADSKARLGRSAAPKKPTVEAVMNTVRKMTAQAEKKSADVDVLEVQLKKLGIASANGRPRTPDGQKMGLSTRTPGSGRSSVFYTPESSSRRSRGATPAKAGLEMLSNEDKDRSQAKSRTKKQVAATLKAVLEEKQRKARAGGNV